MTSPKASFTSMRQSFLPTNASSKGSIQVKKDANIMEQMVSYDSDVINTMIEQLNEDIAEQSHINEILKTANYDDNISEIENFIADNKTNISSQVTNLENSFTTLKNIVDENNNLKNDQKEYDEIVNNDQVIRVAEDIRKLKSLKNSALLFLQQNGIHVKL